MEKRYVNIQVLKATEDKIDVLQKMIKSSTKSDVIKISVELSDLISDHMSSGGDIILRDNQGNEEKLIINSKLPLFR